MPWKCLQCGTQWARGKRMERSGLHNAKDLPPANLTESQS
jgi:hypothetical protein